MSACCEDTCCDPQVTNTPGPAGEAGENGADGTDGISAFALVANYSPAAQPVMPAEGASVTVNTTTSTSFLAIGEIAFVQNWGYMLVTALPSATSVTLENIEDSVTGDYSGNAAPGTALAAASSIVPGGLQGPAGSAPAGALLSTNNLSDLTDPAVARTNLGLGDMAEQDSTNVSITGGAISGITDLAVADGGTGAGSAAGARTNLGLVIGTDIQPFNALLLALAGLAPTVANRFIYTTGVNTVAVAALGATGTAVLAAATPAAARTAIAADQGYGVIARNAAAVDVNVGPADTAMTTDSTSYIIDKIVIYGATLSLTTATCGVFTAAGGAGTTIAADQAMSALTSSSKFDDLTLEAVVGTDVITSGTLYFRIGTPQGAAGTVDVVVYGWKLD